MLEINSFLDDIYSRSTRFHWSLFISICFVTMRIPWCIYNAMFLAAVPPQFHCLINVNQNTTVDHLITDGDCNLKCDVVVFEVADLKNNHTGYSIVTEWDLVCSNAYFVWLDQTLIYAGALVGSLTMAPLGDKFGRRNIFLSCIWVQMVVGVVVFFSVNIYMFIILRCFMSCLNIGCSVLTFCMLVEWFPDSKRTLPMSALNIFWGIGTTLLPVFGWLIRDWRYLELVLVLSGLLTFPLFYLLPESLYFAQSTNNPKLQKKSARWAAKIAGIPKNDIDAMIDKHFTQEEVVEKDVKVTIEKKTEKKDNVFNTFFYNPRAASYFCSMIFFWFLLSATYNLSYLNSVTFNGNMYINSSLSGLFEILGIVVSLVITLFVRRTWILSGSYFLSGTLFATAYAFSKVAQTFAESQTGATPVEHSLAKFVTPLALAARSAVAGGYIVQIMYGAELLPNHIRGQGIGLFQFCENLAPLIVPYINASQSAGLNMAFGPISMLLLFGTLVMLQMPETKGLPLPDSIRDILSRPRRGLWRLCGDSIVTETRTNDEAMATLDRIEDLNQSGHGHNCKDDETFEL